MPADYLPDFDTFDEQPPPVTAAPPPAEPDDPWGFNAEQPPKKEPGKKKKKGKKDAAARRQRVEDGEESSAYPKSVTPSPPTENGVKLAVSPAPTHTQPISARAPLVSLDDGDDTPAVEAGDAAALLQTAPKASPPASPVVKSPRQATVRPVPITSPSSRPVSFHGPSTRDRNNSLTNSRPIPQNAQASHGRRESFASSRPRFVEPPPPHMPQAHFFTLPGLGFSFNQKQDPGKPAGSNGYCCRIDSLADAGDDVSAKKARDALLVGSEGGLEVFRILPNKLEVVGRLEGLKGSVVGAKVLPHTDKLDDLQPLRPLVAVTVHGSMHDDRSDSGPEGEGRAINDSDLPSHFQTVIEVYSLQTQHYIATLYRSAPTAIEFPMTGQASSLPEHTGDLHLDAKGQYITVSSGKSGEVFVFTQAPYAGIKETRFRCIGKFWTSIQKPLTSTSRPAGTGDEGASIGEARVEPPTPLCSLSPRWLSTVPPLSSSNISVQGVPLLSDVNPSPPGITSHAAPTQPAVSCEVAGTDVEGAWSRLGRQAAQGLVKYSQKGIEMGIQGWKELTQPSPPGSRTTHDRPSSQDLFPPTKGPSEDPHRFAKEPAVVSIVDLQSLLVWEESKAGHLPPPMSTFALLEGCNFVSLSSTGTRLATASRKGEVATIWDLTHAAHGTYKSGSVGSGDAGTSPCIKQLQRIVRNTPSTVLDCAWSRDDDAIALLTAHGTIHLHEVSSLPASSKRKRASVSAAPAAEKAGATVSLSSGMSPPSENQSLLGSIRSGWQTVSTGVNSIRTTNPASAFGLPTTFAGFRNATAAASNASSRAVARGLSQGYTAAKGGASDYWHADDNKIRHTKALQEPFSARSLGWIRRNNTTSIAITCGGSIHVHPVQRISRRKGDTVVSGLKNERYAQKTFPLPPITTRSEVAELQNQDACTDQGPHGFWSLRHSSPPAARDLASWQKNMLLLGQSSDVETNPPYCPFHVDPRVSIHAFDDHGTASVLGAPSAFDEFQLRGHGDSSNDAWTFGEPLPPSVKINDCEDFHDEGDFDFDGEAADENDIASQVESKLTIQPSRSSTQAGEIRINTRRRTGNGDRGFGGAGVDFDLPEDDESVI